MVVVPAGEFLMGSPQTEPGRSADEGPQRTITFAEPFAVGRTEITRRQYAAFVEQSHYAHAGACNIDLLNQGDWQEMTGVDWHAPQFEQNDEHPVVCVSWDDAQAYLQWLNSRTHGGYRLLSESEWEYAARAGATTQFPWGTELSRDRANYGADHCCRGFAGGPDRWINTAPTGSFPANAFGLSDMIGNVWEWTADCNTPTGEAACDERTIRGGGWVDFARFERVAKRFGNAPTYRSSNVGFRVARSLGQR